MHISCRHSEEEREVKHGWQCCLDNILKEEEEGGGGFSSGA